MTEQNQESKITIIAIVVTPTYITLYKQDGTRYVMQVNDIRGPAIIEKSRASLLAKQPVEVDLAYPVPPKVGYSEYESHSRGITKFFRLARKKVMEFLEGDTKPNTPEVVESLPTPEVLGNLQVEGSDLVPKVESSVGISQSVKPVVMSNDEKIAEASKKLDALVNSGVGTESPEFHKDLDEKKETIVAVKDGKIIPDIQKLHSTLKEASRLKDFKGFDAFMDRIMSVVDKRRHSVEDLLKFMEKGNMPIADDGSIVIYKRLNKQGNHFVDVHSGNVKQKLGSHVFMAEELVDPNRTQDCSNGLHVATQDYIRSFSGDVTIIGKVAPEDVIAVPQYSVTKMRVCGYKIVHVLNSVHRKWVNGGGLLDKCDAEGAQVLNRILRGLHTEVIQKVEITGQKGAGLKIEDIESGSINVQEFENTVLEPTNQSLDVKGFNETSLTGDPVTAEELKGVAKPVKPKKEAATVKSKKAKKAKQSSPKLKEKKVSTTLTSSEEAKKLWGFFEEAKASGNRANTKDAAQELSLFKTRKKKGWEALGLPKDTGDKLKTWL